MLTDKDPPATPPPPTPPPKLSPRKALPTTKSVKPAAEPVAKVRAWRKSLQPPFVGLTWSRKTQGTELDRKRRKSTPATISSGGTGDSDDKPNKRFSMLDPGRHEFLSTSAPFQQLRRWSKRVSIARPGLVPPKVNGKANVEDTVNEEWSQNQEEVKDDNIMSSIEQLDQDKALHTSHSEGAYQREVHARTSRMQKQVEQRRRSSDRTFLAASLTRVPTPPSLIHIVSPNGNTPEQTSMQAQEPHATCDADELRGTASYMPLGEVEERISGGVKAKVGSNVMVEPQTLRTLADDRQQERTM